MTWLKRVRATAVISSIWAATWGGFAAIRLLSNLIPGLRTPGLPRWDFPLRENLEVIVPIVATYAAVGAGIGALYAAAIYVAGRRWSLRHLSYRFAAASGAVAGASVIVGFAAVRLASGGMAADAGAVLVLNATLGMAAGCLTLWAARRGATPGGPALWTGTPLERLPRAELPGDGEWRPATGREPLAVPFERT